MVLSKQLLTTGVAGGLGTGAGLASVKYNPEVENNKDNYIKGGLIGGGVGTGLGLSAMFLKRRGINRLPGTKDDPLETIKSIVAKRKSK